MARTHDVIVIGGGVNGTGVARDCALRGLRVVLFERNDLAFGASGNSSGMIHGGARYLTAHPSVTEASCRDSGFVQQIAPHLLFRIPFVFPVRGSGMAVRAKLNAVDAFFSYYDKYQPLKHGKQHTRLTASELKQLVPEVQGDFAGAITFDEWGIDGARLCVANAVDARENNAQWHNHTDVEAVERAPTTDGAPACWRVTARDRITGATHDVQAPVVVNATGAWSPMTTTLFGGGEQKVRLRPSKGIHVVFDRRLSNYAVVAEAIDGREIFLMPWQTISWIGTTDDDFYGDLDRPRAVSDEVRYLVQGVASVMPSVRDARVIGTTVGARPTLFEWGPSEDALSREHEIVDHAEHGSDGVYSMIGGKLASYRVFAQEMSDLIVQRMQARKLEPLHPWRRKDCTTHLSPLPGGDAAGDHAGIVATANVDEYAARRLIYRHGSRALRVISSVPNRPTDATVACACEPVLESEVRYACREEGARTLADIARRTRLGLGPCGGMKCALRAGEIVAEECGYPMEEASRMALSFVQEGYENRVGALEGAQARQEELLLAAFASNYGPKKMSELERAGAQAPMVPSARAGEAS